MGKSKSNQCRFCLEDDSNTNLISPCLCKGSFQFIHNTCLLKWYNHEPSKALHCSVCLEPFSKETMRSVEDLNIFKPYLHILLKKPFFSVLLNHWIYFSCYSNLNNFRPVSFSVSYTIYQSFIHLVVFAYLIGFILDTKNKSLYFQLWMTKNRLLLIPIHLFLFLGMVKTTWIGGMSSNVCLYLYFYEHLTILTEINQKNTFIFISRIQNTE